MKKLLFIITLSVIFGCKKDKPAPIPSPSKASLSFPVKDETCTAGDIISTTQSSINFKWATASNAESYELTIKNLESGEILNRTSTTPELVVTLNRNTPYSWYVTSKSTKTTVTAQSDIWRFYNSGPGKASYSPFPAEILSPTFGETITTPAEGKISLSWTGSDVDNDIAGYDVHLGTTASPVLLKADLKDNKLTDVVITAKTTYYWKVITKDTKGNKSDSGTYTFKTN